MSEQESQPEVQNELPPRKPPSLFRRAGCLILLVCWFTFILSPCALLTLARDGEISISQGDLPNQNFRLWLVMEIEQRGIGISTTSVQEIDGAQCLQTNVSYIFWQGENEPAIFCECYTRSENSWNLTSTQQGLCTP